MLLLVCLMQTSQYKDLSEKDILHLAIKHIHMACDALIDLHTKLRHEQEPNQTKLGPLETVALVLEVQLAGLGTCEHIPRI